jgi:hypothetical protein
MTTKKIAVKVMPDGTKVPYSIEQWVNDHLTGDDLTKFKTLWEQHIAEKQAHQAAGHSTATEIVENGVVVGWEETVNENAPASPTPSPELTALTQGYFDDETIIHG